MATSKRDVTLGVAIETSGDESLRQLSAEVRKLAKDGGDAAPQYKAFADQLDRLGQQASSIKSFEALATDLSRLTAEQTRAAGQAQVLGTELAAQGTAVDALRTKQAEWAAAVVTSREAMFAARDALKQLNAETTSAGRTDQAYISSRATFTRSINENAAALRSNRDALKEATAGVNAAAQAQQQLDAKFTSATSSVDRLSAAVARQSRAVAESRAALEAAGASAEDLVGSEERLRAAQEGVLGSVAALRTAEAELATARQRATETAALAYKADVALAAIRKTISERKDAAAEQERADALKRSADSSSLAYKADLALKNIRQEIIDQKADAAEVANAEAKRASAEASKLAERAEQALFNIRKSAAQEMVAADVASAAAAENNLAKIQKEVEAVDRLANEAKRLNAAAEYTRFWATELDALDAKAKRAAEDVLRMATAAEASKKAFNDAFGTTGVRSLQNIQAEVNKVDSALATLEAMYRSGAISAQDFARATGSAEVRLRQLRQEAASMPQVAGVFESMNSQINGLIQKFGSLSAAIATVGFAVKPVIDANVELEALRRTLTFVTGSSEAAAQQIKVLQDAANKSGLSVGQLANSFQLFEASMLKSGQSVAVTQTLFEGVTAAAGKLGLSTDRVSGILLALGQVASKGKLSLEELQGQIGESLPGALKIASDSLGITSAQLTSLMANGKVMASDFLPAFGTALKTTFDSGTKPVEGLAQAFNRLKNAATATSQQLLDTAVYRGLSSSIDSLAKNFDTLVGLTYSAAKGFAAFKAIDMAREFLGIKAAVEAAAAAKVVEVQATTAQIVATEKVAVATRAGVAATTLSTEALAANTVARVANTAASNASVGAMAAAETAFFKTGTAAAGAASKVGSLVTALGGPYGAALTAAIAFQDQLGNAIARTAAKWSGAVDEIAKNEAALAKQAKAEADAAKVRAGANAVVSKSFIGVQAGYDKILTSTEANIKVVDKLVKAKKEEGDALVKSAELSGDEARAKLAAADAARENEAQVRRLVDAKATEVTLLEEERAALVAAAGAQSTWTQDRRDFFKTFDEDLEKKRADLELTKQQAESESVIAIKAKLASDAVADHSKSVEALRLAWEDSKVTLATYNTLLTQGLATKAQWAKASQQAAAAEGLYRDAINDAAKAITNQIAAGKERASLGQQSIDIKRKEIETDLKIADATGQYSNKLEAQIKLKGLEIEASRNKSTELQRESNLMLQQAALMQSNLKLGDANYAQKQREIDAIISAARAKANESLIEQQALRALRAELALLDGSLNQTAIGFGQLKNAVDAAGVAYDAFSAKGQKIRNDSELSTLKPGGANVDAQGFSKASDGSRFNPGGQQKPPDDSGNWTFVPEQRTNVSLSKAQEGAYVVPGVGYWQSTLDQGLSVGDSAPDAAFAALGLTSPTAAKSSSKAAEDAFLQIFKSNVSTASKKDAFFAWAKAAVAANGGSIPANVSKYAAQLGLDATSVEKEVKFTSSGGTGVSILPSDLAAPSAVAPTATPASASQHTLTINVNGVSRTVQTASEADSQAVASIIQQLADASSRNLSA